MGNPEGNPVGNALGDFGTGWWEVGIFNKAVIGGNLAFEITWWGDGLGKICGKFYRKCLGNAARKSAGNSVGNALENPSGHALEDFGTGSWESRGTFMISKSI